MTGFIEVRSDDCRRLVNIDSIRYMAQTSADPKQCVIRFDAEPGTADKDARLIAVDHTYDELVQLILKTDCAAVAR
jgi:hypothetical protein